MEDTEVSINLTLTVAQANVILNVLSEAPYRIAQPLIQTIQEQAAPQLQAAQAQAQAAAPEAEAVEAEAVEA
jgi:hypothetical protein